MTPTIAELTPTTGPTSGGDLVSIWGTAFAEEVQVHFGDVLGTVLSVRREAAASVAVVRTPPHPEALVDVVLANLNAGGVPIPGESATRPNGYRFERPRLAKEADLTRLVRTLLQALKKQIIANVALSVSVDYDDTPLDDLDLIALAKVPSIVLSGPRLRENRLYSTNILREEIVVEGGAPVIRRRRPPYTVDLEFSITAASDRTVELLNLTSAISAFLNTNRWIRMDRDPSDPSAGIAQWELDPVGEVRTNLQNEGDIRACVWGLLIRGFNVDEGLPADLGRAVSEDPSLTVAPKGDAT